MKRSNTYFTEAQQLLGQLMAAYPKAFSDNPEAIRPLVVGVHYELLPFAESLGFNKVVLRRALALYTGRGSYLYALGGKQARVNLAGEPAGEVTEAHAKWARQHLRERKKQKQLRAKASAPAKAAAPQPKSTLTLRKVKAGVA